MRNLGLPVAAAVLVFFEPETRTTAPVIAVRALDADEIPPVVGGAVYEPRGC